jgi:hypothetical protein
MLSAMPRIRPPSAAPGMLPRPPRITTMNALTKGVPPLNGDSDYNCAISPPAKPANAAATKNAAW